jgi:hypothetical protein
MHSVILDRWLILNYLESHRDCRKYTSNVKRIQVSSATFDRKIFRYNIQRAALEMRNGKA